VGFLCVGISRLQLIEGRFIVPPNGDLLYWAFLGTVKAEKFMAAEEADERKARARCQAR
jgi:hypothetical protein